MLFKTKFVSRKVVNISHLNIASMAYCFTEYMIERSFYPRNESFAKSHWCRAIHLIN